MRILYVEDEKYLAEAVIHILKKSKINVDWVADGEEGLEMALTIRIGYSADDSGARCKNTSNYAVRIKRSGR